jgi:hypothetical protein
VRKTPVIIDGQTRDLDWIGAKSNHLIVPVASLVGKRNMHLESPGVEAWYFLVALASLGGPSGQLLAVPQHLYRNS